jgi:hypothetical protein
MAVDVGTGTTLTGGTSGWTSPILSIEVSDISRESVETSHLGTTTAKTFMPGDLYDPGSIELEILFDTDNVSSVGLPPISAAAETWTITFPIPSGLATGATAAGSGFLTGWGWSIPLEDRVTGTVTLKMTGTWSFVDAG